MPKSSFHLTQIIAGALDKRNDRPAIVDELGEVTWRELARRTHAAAGEMRARSVGEGDRIVILSRNRAELLIAVLAAALIGAVAVPINSRLSAPEIAVILEDSGASLLFAEDAFAPLIAESGIYIDLLPLEDLGRGGSRQSADWESPAYWHARAAPQEVALQIYTSGTTGMPKGALLTHSSLEGFVGSAAEYGFTSDKTNLVPLPMSHIGGIGWALMSMYAGGSTVLMADFKPAAFFSVVAERRVTHAILVPASLRMIVESVDAAGSDMSSLETIMYGASPIGGDLLRDAMAIMPCAFIQTYGATEMSGPVTSLPFEDHRSIRPELLQSAGHARAGVTLRIVKPDGRDADEGLPGELWVRTVQNMGAYWRRPEETMQVLTPDGWFRTGDIGYLRDGYLYLCDRLKDVIVSGGENVYPAEVEKVLIGHADVADVAVIGVPSEKWGEEVKAIVVPAHPGAQTPQDLIDFARARLAGFKVPKSISYVDALPRTASGKILKKDLRDQFWQGHDRRIG